MMQRTPPGERRTANERIFKELNCNMNGFVEVTSKKEMLSTPVTSLRKRLETSLAIVTPPQTRGRLSELSVVSTIKTRKLSSEKRRKLMEKRARAYDPELQKKYLEAQRKITALTLQNEALTVVEPTSFQEETKVLLAKNVRYQIENYTMMEEISELRRELVRKDMELTRQKNEVKYLEKSLDLKEIEVAEMRKNKVDLWDVAVHQSWLQDKERAEGRCERMQEEVEDLTETVQVEREKKAKLRRNAEKLQHNADVLQRKYDALKQTQSQKKAVKIKKKSPAKQISPVKVVRKSPVVKAKVVKKSPVFEKKKSPIVKKVKQRKVDPQTNKIAYASDSDDEEVEVVVSPAKRKLDSSLEKPVASKKLKSNLAGLKPSKR